METILFLFLTSLLLSSLSSTTADHDIHTTRTSIVFSTYGRSTYYFDIFTLPFPNHYTKPPKELRLTDGKSINYNGHFPSLPSPHLDSNYLNLIYITERDGSPSIYLDTYSHRVLNNNNNIRKRSSMEIMERNFISLIGNSDRRSDGKVYVKDKTSLGGDNYISKSSSMEISARNQVRLIGDGNHRSDDQVSMKDKPSLVGDYLIYVSTHEEVKEPRMSWAGVYSTQLSTGLTRRLTPYSMADFSPATSPSGEWTAVASLGEKGWDGEVDELNTDIYVFRTRDGLGRVMVAEHGGWPSWADESTIYFHRRGDDGWWSIYKVILGADSVVTQRVTPAGLHAFTPAASVSNKSFIAVATRRPNSAFRHIELYDVEKKEFIQVTRYVSPSSHHYNPFISPDSTKIGYHKCRGSKSQTGNKRLLLENVRSPIPEVSLFRVFGSFPSFSSTGHHIAFVDLSSRNHNPGLYVMKKDGSGLRRVVKGMVFSTAWDPKREGVVYTSVGPTFAAESTKVDIISVDINAKNNSGHKRLTIGGENNAFPSPSPDGKWVVFRSGRSGYKNLYVMDAVDGERGGIYRLTEGPWTDTMGNWAPGGEWIAFASDRENPGSGSFEIFMIHPNGTGLKKLVHSGTGGRTNHPWFSPDGKNVVFTSDYAAVSAEPISNPHHYQPYGDIFVVGSDGSGIRRLTHNSFEDGTPTWGPTFIKPKDVAGLSDGSECDFDDCHWLSDFPNNGLIGMASGKVQCGG